VTLWESYKQTLKPLDVEEPIDLWVHRPLAYLIARAAFPTPITPNIITIGSICLGVSAAVCMVREFPHHLQFAGLLLFCSAVFDCADGQLARMRKTSSAFGRMLDGLADLVVSIGAVVGSTYIVWQRFRDPWWQGLIAVALCVVTTVTGSFHTSTYDHYKNLFIRLTHPSYREGEGYESARERYRAARERSSILVRGAWSIYLFYVKSQHDYVLAFDPNTRYELGALPPYDPERAAIYRRHAEPLMRIWRRWFGFGSLVFGISVTMALGAIQYYMLLRLLLLNALFYGYMRPRQRKASVAAFAALAALDARLPSTTSARDEALSST
jgi:phosphatidylglycerophosphate synthase